MGGGGIRNIHDLAPRNFWTVHYLDIMLQSCFVSQSLNIFYHMFDFIDVLNNSIICLICKIPSKLFDKTILKQWPRIFK